MVSSGTPDDSRPRVWSGLPRLAGLSGFVLLGALLSPSHPDRGLLLHSPPSVAGSLAIGALVAIGVLAVVGAVIHLVARARGRSLPWTQALLGPATVAFALAVLVVGAGARIIGERGAPTANSARQVADQRLRTQRARAWSGRVTPIVVSLRNPYRADAAFHRSLAHQSNSVALRSQAARQRASFSRALGQLGEVPTPPIPALRRSTAALRRSLTLFARGYAEIHTALAGKERRGTPLSEDSGAGRPLRIAVAHTRRARRLLQAWSARLNTIAPLFYGR